MVINWGEPYHWLDLRADDHDDPLAELRRLCNVANEVYLTVADYWPTAANPTGITGSDRHNAAIGKDTERRGALGKSSQPRATGEGC